MATKWGTKREKKKTPNTKVAKKMISKTNSSNKQRYFRYDRVESAKLDGWKEVKEDLGKHNRKLGVRNGSDDLVLMEK